LKAPSKLLAVTGPTTPSLAAFVRFYPQSGHEPLRVCLTADQPSMPGRWYSELLADVDQRLRADLMLKKQPKYDFAQPFGRKLGRAAKLKDYGPLHTLLRLLQAPFD
jgi:hypothetical protein